MSRHRLLLTGLIGALLIGQGCLLQAPGKLQVPVVPAAAGVISQNGAGLVANNAGTLTGRVSGPSAALVANNAGNLIANNGAGLIANNGGGLGGRYRTLAGQGALVAVPGARVSVTDLAGKSLSGQAVVTDAMGAYTVKGLKPSGAIVVVRVSYTLADRPVTLSALVAAPRKGTQAGDVSPASTLVAKKVGAALTENSLRSQALSPTTLAALTAELAPLMSDQAIAVAALTPDADAAAAFDAMVAEVPSLAAAAKSAAPALVSTAPEPAATAGAGPTTRPTASAPAPTPTATATATSAPNPTPTPSPTPRLTRLAGSAVKGYTEATGGDLATARFNEFAGMAYDGANTLYVADESGSMVRAIDMAARTTRRLAGSATGARGFSGDGGPADKALLSDAHGVAIGAGGKLYVCDKNNQRIRVIAPDGTIDTVAGGGGTYGDGPARSALLGQTQGIAAGADGVVFFTMRTLGTAYENVVRLNPDGTVKLLTDKAVITSPGAIAVDKAKGLVYFTNNHVIKVLRDAYATPGAPVDVFTAPPSGNPMEVRGLAFDPAGALYAFASDYNAVNNSYGHVNARLYRIPLGADGLASGPAVHIAGSGGTGTGSADYDLPITGVRDPLTQLLSGGGSGMLELGPTGTLFIGHTLKLVSGTPSTVTQWTQILQLTL